MITFNPNSALYFDVDLAGITCQLNRNVIHNQDYLLPCDRLSKPRTRRRLALSAPRHNVANTSTAGFHRALPPGGGSVLQKCSGICHPSKPLVMLDAPGLANAIKQIHGPACGLPPRLDLLRLKQEVRKRFRAFDCRYIVAHQLRSEPSHKILDEAKNVINAQWRFVQAPCPKNSKRSAVESYIIGRICAARSRLVPEKIIIGSHNENLVDPLAAFLDAGGSVTILAFLPYLPTELCMLTHHSSKRCRELDLALDLNALTHHPALNVPKTTYSVL